MKTAMVVVEVTIELKPTYERVQLDCNVYTQAKNNTFTHKNTERKCEPVSIDTVQSVHSCTAIPIELFALFLKFFIEIDQKRSKRFSFSFSSNSPLFQQ